MKTPKELIPKFYKQYGLYADGGYSDSKVKIEITKSLYFYFPNFPARRKALLKHDIHHLVTEYPTTMKGESEISAWEIGSGCGKYWAAWAIDTSGMMLAVFFNIQGIYKAFVRGMRSINLYSDILDNEKAMSTPVEELRQILHVPPYDEKIKPTVGEFFSFLIQFAIGGIYSLASLLLLPFFIIYNIVVFISERIKAA